VEAHHCRRVSVDRPVELPSGHFRLPEVEHVAAPVAGVAAENRLHFRWEWAGVGFLQPCHL
jgi:hypothetical protein